MLLGFAVTRHCNLRCPHCIRDDVTDVRSLDVDLVADVTNQALNCYGSVTASLTGGEPLLHPELERLIGVFRDQGVPWRFTTNAWHLARALPILEHHPPTSVRISLSGATADVHDAERGRGSWRRAMEAVAICTARRWPVHLAMVVDTRTRDQLRTAAELAEGLGVTGLSFQCAQPVPASAARGSDLPPTEWPAVRDAIDALAAEPGRRTRIGRDYGFPFAGSEQLCSTFRMKQIYVDVEGRLCTCCQLSEYGWNTREVVADLAVTPLVEAVGALEQRLAAQRAASRPTGDPNDPADAFPCLRCARACGKLRWLARFPESSWHEAAPAPARPERPDHAPAAGGTPAHDIPQLVPRT